MKKLIKLVIDWAYKSDDWRNIDWTNRMRHVDWQEECRKAQQRHDMLIAQYERISALSREVCERQNLIFEKMLVLLDERTR